MKNNIQKQSQDQSKIAEECSNLDLIIRIENARLQRRIKQVGDDENDVMIKCSESNIKRRLTQLETLQGYCGQTGRGHVPTTSQNQTRCRFCLKILEEELETKK